jgi:hypothetical protein
MARDREARRQSAFEIHGPAAIGKPRFVSNKEMPATVTGHLCGGGRGLGPRLGLRKVVHVLSPMAYQRGIGHPTENRLLILYDIIHFSTHLNGTKGSSCLLIRTFDICPAVQPDCFEIRVSDFGFFKATIVDHALWAWAKTGPFGLGYFTERV